MGKASQGSSVEALYRRVRNENDAAAWVILQERLLARMVAQASRWYPWVEPSVRDEQVTSALDSVLREKAKLRTWRDARRYAGAVLRHLAVNLLRKRSRHTHTQLLLSRGDRRSSGAGGA